jgi:oligoribonuclease
MAHVNATPSRFVWCDLEMTGLDPKTCVIVEIGVVITGPDLVPIAEIEHAIWQPDEALARMEPFVRDMHTKNGLLERVRASRTSLKDAERSVLSLVQKHVGFRDGILAGNSIHVDRRFLIAHMPTLEEFLHYRMLDVSSLKVLARAWYPNGPEFKKDSKDHTALSDLRASLEELAFYKANYFKPAT